MGTAMIRTPDLSPVRTPATSWQDSGPLLWAELHHWAIEGGHRQGQAWLEKFATRIPCGDCRRHWTEIVDQNPPEFGSIAALFRWTVDMHNRVNERLGKPTMSLDEAIVFWSGQRRNGTVAPRDRKAVGRNFVATERAENDTRELSEKNQNVVDCIYSQRNNRAAHVTCALGLYDAQPHVALCARCERRRSRSTEELPRTEGAAPAVPNTDNRLAVGSDAPVRTPAVERLLLKTHLSPGDIVMLTATVRDLHRAYPGRFETAVQTSAAGLWDNNPWVSPLRADASYRRIDMHYPLINRSNQTPLHFLHGYTEYLAQTLGLDIPVTEFRGDVHLSDEEKQWTGQVEEEFGHRGRYWIIMAGGKYDFTAKWWPPEYYQKVVDHFAGRLQFVQCGEQSHWHPRLRGALNLVGRTSLRQFVRLMYHAEGVVCPVTFAMHLAAAVPTKTDRLRPCVVIAGGREPPHWEAYPGHQFLHTVGALPCCAHGGCWRSRCQTVGDGDAKDRNNLCERPVPINDQLRVPQCMVMIRPEDVIRSIEKNLLFA